MLQVHMSKIRIKCKYNNVFSNKIKPLHVSANDGHHWKATNTSREHACNTCEAFPLKCWSPSDDGHHWPKHVKA
jgi:hypothetical protein